MGGVKRSRTVYNELLYLIRFDNVRDITGVT